MISLRLVSFGAVVVNCCHFHLQPAALAVFINTTPCPPTPFLSGRLFSLLFPLGAQRNRVAADYRPPSHSICRKRFLSSGPHFQEKEPTNRKANRIMRMRRAEGTGRAEFGGCQLAELRQPQKKKNKKKQTKGKKKNGPFD